MRAVIETQVVLDEPSADQGLVTWFDVRILEGFEGADDAAIGWDRVARVHVGQALDVGESVVDVLGADSGELAALHHVFFDEGGFRDEFVQGAGSDLLYVSEVRFEPGWEARNIDLALVRRLCDTLGQGCEVAVIPCLSQTDGERWQRLGFTVTGSAKEADYLYLPLGSRQARVARNDDLSSCGVVRDPFQDVLPSTVATRKRDERVARVVHAAARNANGRAVQLQSLMRCPTGPALLGSRGHDEVLGRRLS